MKYIFILFFIFGSTLFSQELKITSDFFSADENIGVSVFEGNVNVIKRNDELNASKVEIFTNKQNKPTKFIATGDVSFVIETEEGTSYAGVANRVVYFPIAKEYHFFQNVHLKQLNEKKEIQGDEVVLKTLDGKAYAKGVVEKPVIMIFDMSENKKDE